MAEHMPTVTATAVAWRGSVEPYVVGDPGRAAERTVPLPDDEHWHRRDTVVDGISLMTGRNRVAELRAVSNRGLVHRHYGRIRQDEYGYRRTSDGRYLVMCVADGISSGRHSHRAAVVAARRGTDRLASLLRTVAPGDLDWSAFIRWVAEQIVRVGRRHLKALDIPGADEFTDRQMADHLATTALYAVLDLDVDQQGYRVDLCAVGDTSAWVLGADGGWQPLQPVKNEGAQLYSPSVSALPVAPPESSLSMRATVYPGEALVLVSDGIGDALGSGTGEVGQFLAEAWRRPPSSLDFAAQAEFARKSFDDDRTAIVVWPTDHP